MMRYRIGIVITLVKEIELIQIVSPHILQHGTRLLPQIVICLGSIMRDRNSRNARITDRRKNQEAVTIRGPGFPDGPDPGSVKLFCRDQNAHDSRRPTGFAFTQKVRFQWYTCDYWSDADNSEVEHVISHQNNLAKTGRMPTECDS